MSRITTFKGFLDYTWILEKEMEWKMCERPVKSTGIYKTLLWCNLIQDFLKKISPFRLPYSFTFSRCISRSF